MVFQHIPYFLSKPDEDDDGYFNLPKKWRFEILDKLTEAGMSSCINGEIEFQPRLILIFLAGVRYIFTGHYHRNAGGTYKNIEEVVTSAIGAPLGDDPSGFRIVSVNESAISHDYVPIHESVPLV